MGSLDKILAIVFASLFLCTAGYIIGHDDDFENIEVLKFSGNTAYPTVEVTITGMVKNEGTYNVEVGSDVYTALCMAGGILRKADISAIDMNMPITDKLRLNIPKIKGGSEDGMTDYAFLSDGYFKCNINTADLELLMTLDGVGEKYAQRIIDYRDKNGAFKSIEDILKVDGIGKDVYERIKEYISVE